MAAPPRDIDDYLANVSPQQRAGLQKLRRQIHALVRGAEECISYSMPAFREPGGHVFAGFLATNKGCSYFPFSGTTLDDMAADLAGYSRTKSGLHFDPERGLPQALLRKLIAARRAEIADKPAKKQPKPAKKQPKPAKKGSRAVKGSRKAAK